MPETPIQQTDVINCLDRLRPGDLSLDGGSFNPDVLVPTYPVESGWVGMELVSSVVAATSINGANVYLNDTDDMTTQSNYAAPDITKNRYYVYTTVILAGGTVANIRIAHNWLAGGVTNMIRLENCSNAGWMFTGPWFVPAGVKFRIYNSQQGGAGDTMAWQVHGFQADPGVALPLIPAVAQLTE